MAPDTRYNVELLEKVRDVIADEDKHDQSLWMRVNRAALKLFPNRVKNKWGDQFIEVSCPTAACVAGWAASLCGGKMIVDEAEMEYGRGSVEVTEVMVDGEPRQISTFAREQLGLTANEADALFAAEWSNEDVLDNLDEIIRAAYHGKEWDVRWVNEEGNDYDDEDGGY